MISIMLVIDIYYKLKLDEFGRNSNLEIHPEINLRIRDKFSPVIYIYINIFLNLVKPWINDRAFHHLHKEIQYLPLML